MCFVTKPSDQLRCVIGELQYGCLGFEIIPNNQIYLVSKLILGSKGKCGTYLMSIAIEEYDLRVLQCQDSASLAALS